MKGHAVHTFPPPGPRWMEVPGGTCLYGDAARPRPVATLLVAETPLTTHHLTADTDSKCGAGLPIIGIDHAQAGRLAATLGGRLPTSTEWEWIAAGPHRRSYPWGEQPWTPGRANLSADTCRPIAAGPVGRYRLGATPDGVLDMAGNVWEWTASTVMGGGAIIRGGSYASPPLYARTTFLNAAPLERRSPGISVRPVRTP